jgi:hypothetical protein
MQLPPASPPQVSEVTPKVSSSAAAAASTQPQSGDRSDAPATWPAATAAAANGGYLSPGRKAAGKAAGAGSPAVDTQMPSAIGVA